MIIDKCQKPEKSWQYRTEVTTMTSFSSNVSPSFAMRPKLKDLTSTLDGFILKHNKWDLLQADALLLSGLDSQQKKRLHKAAYLG